MSDSAPAPALESRGVLLGMDLPRLTEIVASAGYPAFRARQLYHWLYNRAAFDFSEMHNIARDFRTWLAGNYAMGHLEIAGVRESTDGTRKILFRLSDGIIVEGVLMRERNWLTQCVSSQAGCAAGCAFCTTGYDGFHRQMTTAEIISQILLAKRVFNDGFCPRNIVFMGMGEPMLNLDNVIPALRILSDPDGMAIAARRITVSTAGILPGIERLARENLNVNIAISLNAPDNDLRNRIMPINKAHPIGSLISACREYPLRRRRRITFEYVMLGGFNDSLEHARKLAALLLGLPCKINLIPWNPDGRLPFRRPSDDTVNQFQQFLHDRHFIASIRYSKGLDIGAACGQLAGGAAARARERLDKEPRGRR
ncbi:MAG: 23S rRNA (adenine(2503)-C(2))-methyltransferase RlmN [bacterium]|nr:23S rRNA (adenine(2503)-C(2))-methyltransferase RlmN [Candidatus Sumerlaeota bacterium]